MWPRHQLKARAYNVRMRRENRPEIPWEENPPLVCERCATTGLIYRHDDDYAKPKTGTLLCPKCHAQRHKELGWGKRGRGKKFSRI